MSSKKIACCTTLNDLYFDGFITFYESLIDNNPSFDFPYYIFSWGELSHKNINYLQHLSKNFIFKKINNNLYKDINYSNTLRKWNINCANRFEIFDLCEYDKIIFFDADMLVLKDIKDVIEATGDFNASEEPRSILIDHPAVFNESLKTFNGGLMVISKSYLNLKTKNELIKIAMEKKWSSDEPILNTYFTNDKVTFFPTNTLVTMHGITKDNFKKAKIIHFVGERKPWYSGSISNRYDRDSVEHIKDNTLLVNVDFTYRQYYNKARKRYEQQNSINCCAPR